MSLFTDPNKIPENYGLRLAAGLILYFLVMKLLGLAHIIELRLLNVFVMVAAIYFALKKFKNTHEHHLNYFRGLATGVGTGAIGSIVFALFMFIYMKVDNAMMQSIIDNDPMGRYLNPYMAAFIIALEGVFSGLLVSFVLINYVDTDDVNDPIGESN
jgi:hypothetical protein